jgi:hypothetical protein
MAKKGIKKGIRRGKEGLDGRHRDTTGRIDKDMMLKTLLAETGTE